MRGIDTMKKNIGIYSKYGFAGIFYIVCMKWIKRLFINSPFKTGNGWHPPKFFHYRIYKSTDLVNNEKIRKYRKEIKEDIYPLM